MMGPPLIGVERLPHHPPKTPKLTHIFLDFADVCGEIRRYYKQLEQAIKLKRLSYQKKR
jgi:hypothetical protein